ncbi:MAG: fibrinogen-like YCDxxxxGGGW domain-containing protein [Myxococcota bacterium]
MRFASIRHHLLPILSVFATGCSDVTSSRSGDSSVADSTTTAPDVPAATDVAAPDATGDVTPAPDVPDVAADDLSLSDDTAALEDTCDGGCGCDLKHCVGTSSQPGLSCKVILASGSSHGDGVYWVDPDGDGPAEAVETVCDMTTDGGGWTRVFGVVVSDETGSGSNPRPLAAGLAAAATGHGHVAPTELAAYRVTTGFTDLRFECKKDAVPRKLHLMTSEPAVLDWLTGASEERPLAAGTFTTLADNTASMTATPEQWGRDSGSGGGSEGCGGGRWGHFNTVPADRLWYSPLIICGTATWMVGAAYRYECDDDIDDVVLGNQNGPKNGYWYIWVR